MESSDASDPAFAAIKLWVDSNNNGRVDAGEESSLQALQLGSIDFATGQINYTNGTSDTLSATILKADTDGIKAEQLKVVGEDGKLHALDAGTIIVHEGYAGQVLVNSKGELAKEGDPDTHWVIQRINSYEIDAKRTGDWQKTDQAAQHRHGGGNAAGAPITLNAGDARIVSNTPVPRPPRVKIARSPRKTCEYSYLFCSNQKTIAANSGNPYTGVRTRCPLFRGYTHHVLPVRLLRSAEETHTTPPR